MKKSISKSMISLAVLSTISFGSAYAADICTDSLQTVCTDTKVSRDQRDQNIKLLKNEIASEASKNAAPRIEQMKKDIPSWRFIKRALTKIKINNQEIMRSAKLRVGDLEKVITNPENVARLKSYLKTGIDESNFEAGTKFQMKSIVDSIVIGNFADFLEKSNLEDNVLAQILGNACGSDGMLDNAFATTLGKEKYVLVCPGFLITLSKEASEQEKFDSVLQAIAHEMGHHLDNSKLGNELYAPYLNCLSTNYVTKFNKTSDDQKFCTDNAKEPKKCDDKVVLSHAGELIADQWGIKVTAIHARTKNYSFMESQTMLVNSWAKLCGSGDEGIHPTGDFRIGTLMRANPNIIDTLSCTDNSSQVSCTFDGTQVIQ